LKGRSSAPRSTWQCCRSHTQPSRLGVPGRLARPMARAGSAGLAGGLPALPSGCGARAQGSRNRSRAGESRAAHGHAGNTGAFAERRAGWLLVGRLPVRWLTGTANILLSTIPLFFPWLHTSFRTAITAAISACSQSASVVHTLASEWQLAWQRSSQRTKARLGLGSELAQAC